RAKGDLLGVEQPRVEWWALQRERELARVDQVVDRLEILHRVAADEDRRPEHVQQARQQRQAEQREAQYHVRVSQQRLDARPTDGRRGGARRVGGRSTADD